MEIGVPNSFIPHDATTPSASPRYDSSGGLTDLLTLVALVLFVASLALAAGSFLYLQYVNSESTTKQAQIQQAQAAFDPALIQQLTRLDTRMNSADAILAAHIDPTAFFAALDETTLTTVSFENLEFSATDPKDITLKMSGVARDVNSVALQADLFGKSGVITDPIFSGIDQQADGVHFDVVATVNPAAINYETLLSSAPPSDVSQDSTAPAAAVETSPFTGAQSSQAPASTSTASQQIQQAPPQASGAPSE